MNPALFKEAEMQTLSPEIERPALHWLALEPLRAAIEFGTHSFSGHTSRDQVDGHPVIIFPGMATGANAVSPVKVTIASKFAPTVTVCMLRVDNSYHECSRWGHGAELSLGCHLKRSLRVTPRRHGP